MVKILVPQVYWVKLRDFRSFLPKTKWCQLSNSSAFNCLRGSVLWGNVAFLEAWLLINPTLLISWLIDLLLKRPLWLLLILYLEELPWWFNQRLWHWEIRVKWVLIILWNWLIKVLLILLLAIGLSKARL